MKTAKPCLSLSRNISDGYVLRTLRSLRFELWANAFISYLKALFCGRPHTSYFLTTTSWLRDYLYISLGGNRVGVRRLYLNLFLVMFASGVWHGANWTFICWGLYHAFFMIAERANNKNAWYYKAPRVVQILLTQVIVLFGWVLFRADNIGEAWRMWKAMLGLMPVSAFDAVLAAEIFTPTTVLFMALAGLLSFWRFRSYDWCNKVSFKKSLVALALFILATLALFTQSYNPFLYFQF